MIWYKHFFPWPFPLHLVEGWAVRNNSVESAGNLPQGLRIQFRRCQKHGWAPTSLTDEIAEELQTNLYISYSIFSWLMAFRLERNRCDPLTARSDQLRKTLGELYDCKLMLSQHLHVQCLYTPSKVKHVNFSTRQLGYDKSATEYCCHQHVSVFTPCTTQPATESIRFSANSFSAAQMILNIRITFWQSILQCNSLDL